MDGKKPARRRAAEKRAKRAKRAKSSAHHTDHLPGEDALLKDAALVLAMGGTNAAVAYVAWHGKCAICRVRVGAVAVQFVDVAPVAQG